MNEEEARYVHALKLAPGIGDILAKQLISYCGSAAAIFKEKKGALLKIPNIGNKTIEALNSMDLLDKAEQCMRQCADYKIQILPYYHKDYPSLLKLVNDSPLLIYAKGSTRFENQKMIAIVGTRNATEYGRQTTQKIVEDLAGYDAVIVSGMAYGIDITAHRAALKNNLPTVAVLAGGLDRIYPAAHRQVAEEMLADGAWMSEYLPGVKPDPHHFPMRNRIIAGMSEALVVVEAANKGGALITANIAHSYDREVFAVPGTLQNKYSEGCNGLIRSQKANIYTSVADLNYLLGWEKGEVKPAKTKIDISELKAAEQKIMRILIDSKSGLQLDELSWKTQMSINETVSSLLSLEFEGAVKSLPGKVYVALY
ncbi:MAG: DNA-processing protein DprA [Reichenbachiella sp.]|uniref:DNA-processing protein DprA n=1 Tax=Reichenbachiella sp. TaxID=2184521 RepID=UPI00326340C4